jgi:hypothetical protein
MPETASGSRLDPAGWNRRDGFSPASPIHILLEIPEEESQMPELPQIPPPPLD